MPLIQQFQYQSQTRPIFSGAETTAEDKWGFPWATPVRFKLEPRAAIALMASGAFQSNWLPTIFEGSWHYPWSQPVKEPLRLSTPNQRFFFAEPFSLTGNDTTIEAKWHYAWPEPIRLSYRQSIRLGSQQAYTGPDRILPTPDVTATMSAFEINSDIFLGAINVYDSGGTTSSNQGARVSITETSPSNNSGMSIEEE